MIVEYIRYQLIEHSARDFLDAYARAATALRSAPECLAYEVAQCTEDACSVIVRIKSVSMEAHLSGFRRSANFPPFLHEVRAFIAEIAEMRYYEVSDAVWSRADRGAAE